MFGEVLPKRFVNSPESRNTLTDLDAASPRAASCLNGAVAHTNAGRCPKDSVGSPGVVDHEAPRAVCLTTQNVPVAARQRHGFAV